MAQLKFNNCEICEGQCGTWEGGGGGSVGINGALGIQFGPDFLNVTGAAKTGITGSATITGKCRCVELALGLKFNGVSVGVTATAFTFEVTLFEGFIVDPRDIGTVKQKLPVP